MSAHVYVPPAPLAEFVELFWIFEGYVQPHAQERLLPTGAMTLVISLDDNHHSGVSGPRTGYMVLDTSRALSFMGVSFKPGGGFPFISMPAGELRNVDVPLDAALGRDASSVRDRLLEATTARERFRILEAALLARSAGRLDRHPAVRHAVSALGAASTPSVAAVTADIGFSQRRFIELFQREVGLTPKAFSRVRRFQHVLTRLDAACDPDWTEIALSCGFFDQAHFIHDFRAFSGVSPSTYLQYRTSRLHLAVHD